MVEGIPQQAALGNTVEDCEYIWDCGVQFLVRYGGDGG